MANNTITETLRFKFNTIARDQSDVTFLDWRDLDLGTRADSNMQKLDTELYKLLKRGLFIANTTTPSANQYVVSNSAIVEMFDKIALLLIPNADNTGITTLQINSFVSSPIKKVSNNTYIDIVAGDLKSKQPTLIYYDLNSNVFVLASALVQSASTTQSGIVQLSNDTNSIDETKAVTPHALKMVADAKLNVSQKGVANGVASLDTDGKVSLTQIPDAILGSLKYIDVWDASGGTTPSNPKNGNYWVISVAGVINTVEYNVKDWLIYNNSTWSKLDGEDDGDTLIAVDEIPSTPIPRDADTLNGQLPSYYAKSSDLNITNTNVNQNKNDISAINDTVLKKDGSVQMTGALKTIGGDVGATTEQLNLGGNYIYNSNGKTISFASNCYFDGTNWRRKNEGKASMFAVVFDVATPKYYTAVSDVADSIITWVDSSPLTASTGLPLTGGTLTGGLSIKDIITTQITQFFNVNRQAIFRNYLSESDYGYMLINPTSTALHDLIRVGRYGVGEYKIYGEHNITVSTSAPSSTLAEGAQHQVYA